MVRDFDPDKLKKVSIADVRVNTWNPKEKKTDEYENIKLGIKQKGVMTPIAVRENNGYEIIDGEQRFTAVSELGYKEVWIYNEGKVSDPEAKELTMWYQQQAPFDSVQEAKFITQLKLEVPNIELPYTETQLIDMEALSNFDFSQYSTERPQDEPSEDTCKHCKIHCGGE